MATKVVAGNTIVLTWIAKKLDDAFAVPPRYIPYDPATPTLILQDQNGVKTTYTYPADPIIKRPTTKDGQPFDPTGSGEYYAAIPTTIDMVETWKYQWKDPDAGLPGLVEGTFTVSAPKIV